MKALVRIAIYGLLLLGLFQAYVSWQQDHVIEQQRRLIRQLWADRRNS